MTAFTPADLLALVERSPATVAAHDRAGWLALFAAHGVIEDPVGSRPVAAATPGATARFYDAFIAPNTIRFDVQANYFGPQQVLRDLTIHIGMGEAVQVAVPMHLVYAACEESGHLKISHLAAHWELVPMVGQLLGQGLAAWPVMGGMGVRLLQQLGVGGLLGFSRAALTPRQHHYRLLAALLQALQAQDSAALGRCFAHGNAVILDGRTHEPLDPRTLTAVRAHKRIAAGRCISASVQVGDDAGVLLGETGGGRSGLVRCVLYR